jgi:hypothetical protein
MSSNDEERKKIGEQRHADEDEVREVELEIERRQRDADEDEVEEIERDLEDR